MKIIHLLMLLMAAFACVNFVRHAAADSFGSGPNMFDIQFVHIGNPGNASDTTGVPDLVGKVNYAYRMGKFEISEQMIDKANILGDLGITKDSRGANKPATNLSWNEAARFINWLNTSTGNMPAYKFALQPRDIGYSANANIELWQIGDAGYNPANRYRNSLARYFLPSGDEWYKAAYYDPTSKVYYDYPTGSDDAPTPVASGTIAGTAVYAQSFAVGPADVTLAGGLSLYGAMGLGGNVYEWEETDVDLVNGPTPGSSNRGIRGGSWNNFSCGLYAACKSHDNPSLEYPYVGFRVASIPEPSTLLLIALTSMGLLLRTRR